MRSAELTALSRLCLYHGFGWLVVISDGLGSVCININNRLTKAVWESSVIFTANSNWALQHCGQPSTAKDSVSQPLYGMKLVTLSDTLTIGWSYAYISYGRLIFHRWCRTKNVGLLALVKHRNCNDVCLLQKIKQSVLWSPNPEHTVYSGGGETSQGPNFLDNLHKTTSRLRKGQCCIQGPLHCPKHPLNDFVSHLQVLLDCGDIAVICRGKMFGFVLGDSRLWSAVPLLSLGTNCRT